MGEGVLSLEGGELSLERGRDPCRERQFATSSNRESRVELSLEFVRLDGGRLPRGYVIAAGAGRADGVDVRCSCRDRVLSWRRSIRDRLISSVVSWRGTWSSTDCPVPTILAFWIRQSGEGPCTRLDRWRRCLMPCLGTAILRVLHGGRGRSWRRGRNSLLARRS